MTVLRRAQTALSGHGGAPQQQSNPNLSQASQRQPTQPRQTDRLTEPSMRDPGQSRGQSRRRTSWPSTRLRPLPAPALVQTHPVPTVRGTRTGSGKATLQTRGELRRSYGLIASNTRVHLCQPGREASPDRDGRVPPLGPVRAAPADSPPGPAAGAGPPGQGRVGEAPNQKGVQDKGDPAPAHSVRPHRDAHQEVTCLETTTARCHATGKD